MLYTNSEYIVLRYQRAPRYQQNESGVWYSSLIEGAITKIYRPTA